VASFRRRFARRPAGAAEIDDAAEPQFDRSGLSFLDLHGL
jgi:hypothetical protein